MQLDLEQFKQTVQQAETIYLATSANDEVTLRPVSPLIMDGTTIYFYTSKDSKKYAQMKANPKVAFSLGVNGSYQGTGAVRFLGSVFSPENDTINQAYRKKYTGAFEMAAPGEDMQSNEFMAIDIKQLKGWVFDKDNPEIPIGVGEMQF